MKFVWKSLGMGKKSQNYCDAAAAETWAEKGERGLQVDPGAAGNKSCFQQKLCAAERGTKRSVQFIVHLGFLTCCKCSREKEAGRARLLLGTQTRRGEKESCARSHGEGF